MQSAQLAQEKQKSKERERKREGKGQTEKNAGKYCVKSQFCLRGRQVERPAYASSCTSSSLRPSHLYPPATAGHCSGNEGFRRQLLLVPSVWVWHSQQWGNGKTQIGKVIAVVGILFFCFYVPSFVLLLSVCLSFSLLLLHLLPQRFSGCQQQLPAGQRLGKHLNAFSCFASFPKEIVWPRASCLLPAACCMPHVACPMLPVSPLRLAMLRFWFEWLQEAARPQPEGEAEAEAAAGARWSAQSSSVYVISRWPRRNRSRSAVAVAVAAQCPAHPSPSRTVSLSIGVSLFSNPICNLLRNCWRKRTSAAKSRCRQDSGIEIKRRGQGGGVAATASASAGDTNVSMP